MKNYQKLTVALMGILLTAGTATMISAHAQEPIPTEATEPTTEICIEPWWHMYELTNLHLQAGDTLRLEFAGNGEYSITMDITDEDDKWLNGECMISDENYRVTYDYTVIEPIDSLKIYTMVFSDNDAELIRHDVVTKPQVVDVVLLNKYLHGKQNLTQEQFIKLDRNDDDRVNIYDFLLIKQEIIKTDNYVEDMKLDIMTEINNTASATIEGWDSAMSDTSYVFTSFQQFDETITPLFRPAVVRSLEESYDEKFFSKYNLCMKLWTQTPDDEFHLHIAGVTVENGTLQIDYEKSDINEPVGTQEVLISQVAMPKDTQYDEVVWNIKGTEQIAYEYQFDSTDSYYPDYSSSFGEIEPKLICSYEELLAYADTLDKFQKETALEKYPEEFFTTKAVYLRPVAYWEAGSSESAWNVRKQGNTITADIRLNCPPTDNLTGTIGLGQLILDKADAENADVSCRECKAIMKNYMSNETFDGEMLNYYIPNIYVTLAVNQYAFKNQNTVDFYWYYNGSGGSGYQFIDSVALDYNYQPFTDNDGNLEGRDYSIIYNPDRNSITVKFKTSADSDEFVTKEFAAPDIW